MSPSNFPVAKRLLIASTSEVTTICIVLTSRLIWLQWPGNSLKGRDSADHLNQENLWKILLHQIYFNANKSYGWKSFSALSEKPSKPFRSRLSTYICPFLPLSLDFLAQFYHLGCIIRCLYSRKLKSIPGISNLHRWTVECTFSQTCLNLSVDNPFFFANPFSTNLISHGIKIRRQFNLQWMRKGSIWLCPFQGPLIEHKRDFSI